MTDSEGSVEISGDERRLHIQAFNYWHSLLDGREFPAVGDMQPEELDRFRHRSFLIDFPHGYGRPIMRFIGQEIIDEEGTDYSGRVASDIPGEGLLGRLTVHYMEVLANRSPIGFEAAHDRTDGKVLLYRGILLPLSDDNETVHFILGVMSWKLAEQDAVATPKPVADQIAAETARLALSDQEKARESASGHADGAPEQPRRQSAELDDDDLAASDFLGLLAKSEHVAGTIHGPHSRSRAALYEVLELAYRLFEISVEEPEVYERALEAAGLRAQARAPFTPILKLVLGRNYDKTRLTEYAGALSFAKRSGQTSGGIKEFVSAYPGGIKGCVLAERAARRISKGNLSGDSNAVARQKLDTLDKIGSFRVVEKLPEGDYFLMLGRRGVGERSVDVVRILDEKAATLEPILRRAGRGEGDK